MKKGQLGIITIVLVFQIMVLVFILVMWAEPGIDEYESQMEASTVGEGKDTQAALMANAIQRSEDVQLQDQIIDWELAGEDEIDRTQDEIEQEMEEEVENILDQEFDEYYFAVEDPIGVEIDKGFQREGRFRYHSAGASQNYRITLELGEES